MATAGQDFGDYRAWLDAAGIDTSLVKVVADKFTASFFCSTDQANNQIASFYTGAMANAGELSFRTRRRRSGRRPGDHLAQRSRARWCSTREECSTLGVRYIWDPGQQCARMDGAQLARRRRRAPSWSSCNDYEFELIRQKTGMSEDDVLGEAEVLDRDPRRARLRRDHRRGHACDVAAVPPDRIVDPTGVGDAFRGGFMKGLAQGRPLTKCARRSAASPPPTRSSTRRPEPRLHLDGVRGRYEKHFGPLDVSAGRPGQRCASSQRSARCISDRQIGTDASRPSTRSRRAGREPGPRRGEDAGVLGLHAAASRSAAGATCASLSSADVITPFS